MAKTVTRPRPFLAGSSSQPMNQSVPKGSSCSSASYQLLMSRHIAVEHSQGNEWHCEVGRQRATNHLGPQRRRAKDDGSRSNWSSRGCCRSRAINPHTLRCRSPIWKGCVNNCAWGWDKGRGFRDRRSCISFTLFFCSSIFKRDKTEQVIFNSFFLVEIVFKCTF